MRQPYYPSCGIKTSRVIRDTIWWIAGLGGPHDGLSVDQSVSLHHNVYALHNTRVQHPIVAGFAQVDESRNVESQQRYSNSTRAQRVII